MILFSVTHAFILHVWLQGNVKQEVRLEGGLRGLVKIANIDQERRKYRKH